MLEIFCDGRGTFLSKRVRSRLDYFYPFLFSAMSKIEGTRLGGNFLNEIFLDFHALSSGNQDGLYHNNIEGDPSSCWHFREINVVKFVLQEWQMKLPFWDWKFFIPSDEWLKYSLVSVKFKGIPCWWVFFQMECNSVCVWLY